MFSVSLRPLNATLVGFVKRKCAELVQPSASIAQHLKGVALTGVLFTYNLNLKKIHRDDSIWDVTTMFIQFRQFSLTHSELNQYSKLN